MATGALGNGAVWRAEVPGAGIDGAVSTCGLVGGGVALNNYQLDAAYAATELLLPGQDVPLTGFTAPDRSDATVVALRAALEEARGSAEGRALIALVAALLHTPTELDGVDTEDPEALAAAQAELLPQTLPTVIERRHTIVEAMDERPETGHWGSLAKTSSLQRGAESLGLDGAAFVHHRPDEFVGDRDWNEAS